MVDLDTKKIIDCIDSRDIGEVCNWLKTYPNLKIVSRDGSTAYRNAIDSANKNIIQVSDRFHLVKGLSEQLNKIFKKILPTFIKFKECNQRNIKKGI